MLGVYSVPTLDQVLHAFWIDHNIEGDEYTCKNTSNRRRKSCYSVNDAIQKGTAVKGEWGCPVFPII